LSVEPSGGVILPSDLVRLDQSMLFDLGIKNFYESLFVKALQQVPGTTMEAIILSGMMNRLSIESLRLAMPTL
jgi:hypothetical protein